ncbi:MAG: helix-hairpin-helix domain-containing protein [Bacteroidales bacterium]
MVAPATGKYDAISGFAAFQQIRLLIILTFISGYWLGLSGQDTIPSGLIRTTDLSDLIEDIAEKSEDDLDYTELVENLNDLRRNPINLNFAAREELFSLPFLNDMQVFHLLAYRETYGYFVTIYELQAVEGFDQHTIQQILPFVTISVVPPATTVPVKNALRYGRNTLLVRYQQVIQEQLGYSPLVDSLLALRPNARYMGGPEKILLRYRFQYGNKIRWGFTAEKDAGEPFFKDKVNPYHRLLVDDKLTNGFDFYSFHFNLRDVGRIKAINLGDYQLRFGQGLTMWNGLAFGKSSDVSNSNRNATGLRPYSSTDENRFFRGAGITIGLGNFDVTGFYSDKRVDAGLMDEESLSEQPVFSSFAETGFHRTPLELMKKNAVRLTVTGGNVSFRKNRLRLGLTGFYTRLGASLQEGSTLYQIHSFHGRENINAGFDYSYLYHRMNFFGEIAAGRNGSIAQLHGMHSSLHPRISLSLIYRDYAPDYQNLFANGLSESNTVNERGLFTGFRILLRRHWTGSGYLDLFTYPWLRYRVNKPTTGNDLFFQIDHTPSQNIYGYLRFRQKTKQINTSSETIGINPIMNYRKSNFRLHLGYAVSPKVSMANRMEYIISANETGYCATGYLFYQDISFDMDPTPVRLFFRYALFDTDTYDERIYAYENDLLYAFSVPAYYYKGSKTVFMIRYAVLEKINLWFRLSHLFYSNRNQVGTGPDQIDGNQKTEVKIQIQVRL